MHLFSLSLIFFISMYANKINLIFNTDSFIKLKKTSSGNLVQLFVPEKATFKGQEGKRLTSTISTDAESMALSCHQYHPGILIPTSNSFYIFYLFFQLSLFPLVLNFAE